MIFNWWKFTAGCQKEDVEGASSLLLSTKKNTFLDTKQRKKQNKIIPVTVLEWRFVCEFCSQTSAVPNGTP